MRVPDRQKQRQEYLRKKAVTTSTVAINRLIYYFFLIGTIGFALATFFVLFMTIAQKQWPVLIGVIMLAYLTMKLAGVCSDCREHVEQTIQEDKAVGYVPPVTPDT